MFATVSASALNVRSMPNIASSVMGVLSEGSVVDVLSNNNGWLVIRFYESQGFVSEMYVDVKKRADKLQAIINTSLLNVREMPATASRVLGKISICERIQSYKLVWAAMSSQVVQAKRWYSNICAEDPSIQRMKVPQKVREFT